MNNINLGERDDYEVRTVVRLDEFKKNYKIWLESYLDLESMYDRFVSDILFDTRFELKVSMDANRISDGMDLRGQYSIATGEVVSDEDSDILWPCTAFEILVSLAMSMEYLDSSDTLHEVPYFYHEMLDNLGIDRDFMEGEWDMKERLIRKVLNKWMNRTYSKNGGGGLFPLKHPRQDQREVELWYQMQAYMIENY